MYRLSPEEPALSITGRYKDVYEHYELGSTLGRGNFGIVREAIHCESGQKLAVKSIEKISIKQPHNVKLEISLLQTIDHPNILKLAECFEDDEYVHIITEKYDCGDVCDRILADGSVSEKEAREIIVSLLTAVEYLHAKDIVHRDIKPENIMLTSSQNSRGLEVKLIDFGLSRKHNSYTDEPMTEMLGSPLYIAPEILKKCYDRSADIWSVGIVAYILLGGYPPFNGWNDGDIYLSILKSPLIFDENDWYGISLEARDFIRLLLDRDPHARPSAELALLHPWCRGTT